VYRIAVIPGDGTGPEVVREGLKVFDAAAKSLGFKYETVTYDFGGDRYLRTGETLPPGALDELRQFDVIYLGAIGHPDVPPGPLEVGILLAIRFGLDQYINLRPVKLYAEHLCPIKGKRPEDVDFVVVRENTEDAYAGLGGVLKKGTPDEVAIAEMIYTRKGVERIIRYAFQQALERDRLRRESGDASRPPKVTLVDKANAVRAHDLWTRAFAEVGEAEFPKVERDHAYVDACCMWMVKNPEWFDVIVTTNLFGDILTDLGAIIQGGMGIAASGNIHPAEAGMFEPIHGSAPKYAGQNVASPLGAIAAVGMMLDFLGESRAAERVEGAIADLLRSGRIPSVDARSGLQTNEIGDMVVREVGESRAG